MRGDRRSLTQEVTGPLDAATTEQPPARGLDAIDAIRIVGKRPLTDAMLQDALSEGRR